MQSNGALTLDFKINWRILLILGIISAMLVLAFSAVAAQVIGNGNGIVENTSPQGAVQEPAVAPSLGDVSGNGILNNVLPGSAEGAPPNSAGNIDDTNNGIQNPNGSVNP
jgi:hypothetical protein